MALLAHPTQQRAAARAGPERCRHGRGAPEPDGLGDAFITTGPSSMKYAQEPRSDPPSFAPHPRRDQVAPGDVDDPRRHVDVVADDVIAALSGRAVVHPNSGSTVEVRSPPTRPRLYDGDQRHCPARKPDQTRAAVRHLRSPTTRASLSGRRLAPHGPGLPATATPRRRRAWRPVKPTMSVNTMVPSTARCGRVPPSGRHEPDGATDAGDVDEHAAGLETALHGATARRPHGGAETGRESDRDRAGDGAGSDRTSGRRGV